jgi:hypothetical protein
VLEGGGGVGGQQGGQPQEKAREGKAFFLERKNQRTFFDWRPRFGPMSIMVQMRTDKSFLLLFFKKEGLPCLSCCLA